MDINGVRLAKFKSDATLEITTTGEPIACRTRFVNPILAKEVKKIIDGWVDRGIAIPTTSPSQSPLVIVSKKTPPYIRVAVDYRKLNAVTHTLRHPIPDITDCIAKISNKNIFSNLDIKEAFHSLEIKDDSQEKTAITTQ